MVTTESFQLAADFIQYTGDAVFLTGKAGTGKTTFLKYCKENTRKQTAIVAPTGVAAINAGGTTIHSFFQLPFNPFIPGNRKFNGDESVNDRQSLLGRMKLTNERREVFRKLELLIIDEISMVRADLLDAMDLILKHIRNQYGKAFGGVQVLFIGDLFQLSPVAKDDEWNILSEYYESPFFFHSKILESNPPVTLTLDKIYRQNDPLFVDLLNQVRNNELDDHGFDVLHERYDPNFIPEDSDGFITLSTHNYKADAINQAALNKLDAIENIFEAQVEGEFSEKSYPAEARLILKYGAQVMFIKNDTEKNRRYFNGKIGIVEAIETDRIFVRCKGESEPIEVNKEKWKNLRYKVDKTNNQVEEEEIGSFTQYPLRLAWAITIHKSQGLTFEKAIIDAGDAFAPGQVYVALSRCTGLDGIVLKSRITKQSLKTDPRIVAFSKRHVSSETHQELLEISRLQYEKEQIKSLYDYSGLLLDAKEVLDTIRRNIKSFHTKDSKEIEPIFSSIQNLDAVAKKFDRQIDELVFQNTSIENNQSLQTRLTAATGYFLPMTETLQKTIEAISLETDSKLLAKEMNDTLQIWYDHICYKVHLLKSVAKEFSIQSLQEEKLNFKKSKLRINIYAGESAAGITEIPHADLFVLLKKKRDELCNDAGLPVYMVAKTSSLQEMIQYLPQNISELNKISGFGPVKSRQYGEAFLEIICDYCDTYGLESLINEMPVEKRQKKKKGVEKTSGSVKSDTKKISLDLFKAGNSIRHIAMDRNLTIGTIESHLCYFIEKGSIKVNEVLPDDIISAIKSAIEIHGNTSTKTIKENLPEEITYGEIRMVIAGVNS